jgi:uncharacterized protein YeeX (DUF496 family)
MSARSQRRHLEDIQRRLMAARESLGILEEQVAVWNEALEEARIRSLVSETPQPQADYSELQKHVTVANEELSRRRKDVANLLRDRDELLRDYSPTEDS